MGFFGDLFGIGKRILQATPVGQAVTTAIDIVGGRGRTQPIAQAPPQLPPLIRPVGVANLQDRNRRNGGNVRIGPLEINPPLAGERGIGISVGAQSGGSRLPFVGEIGGNPEVRNVRVRQCPRGQVLALDGKCYPKSMVPAQFREVRPRPKAAVTAADRKAIRRAAATKKRLIKLTKDAGGHASANRPRPRRRDSS